METLITPLALVLQLLVWVAAYRSAKHLADIIYKEQ